METNFWRDCSLVEVVAGKLHGQPVTRGTRVLAVMVAESAELGEAPEETTANYGLQLDIVCQLLSYVAVRRSPVGAGGLTMGERFEIYSSDKSK